MSGQPVARFADSALTSQACFRAIMRAMSQPGRIETLSGHSSAPPPLMPAAAAALVTLCDFETGLWVAPGLSAACGWLRFETGARLVAEPSQAGFALCEAGERDLSQFHAGTPTYPDRSATLIVQCPALEGGPALTLAGPGIAATASFSVAGLPADFSAQLRTNRALFPLGVDLLFASGDRLLALPRSTRILEAR
jgi:alpha-D-ribose 1-methylphosphonate 5-triphosphate synthase subunit PhnH